VIRTHSSRVARLGLATLTSVTLGMVTIGAAAPARAAEPASLSASMPRFSITIGGAGAPGKAFPAFFSGRNAINARAVFDISKLAGIVTVEFSKTCTTVKDTVSCPIGGGADSFSDDILLIFHPVDGVRDGATGSIVVGATADNAKASPHETTVTIADGIDLVVTSDFPNTPNTNPGDKVAIAASFANAGNKTTDGFQFTFVLEHGLTPDKFSNCEYGDDPVTAFVRCTFNGPDDTLAPGEEITMEPFPAKVNSEAFGPTEADFFVEGLAEASNLPSALKMHKADGSKVLRVHSKAQRVTPRAALPTDVDSNDNIGGATWDVTNARDLATIGDQRSGKVGDTVTVTIGMKDNGPAAVDATRAEQPAGGYVFTVPTDTEAIAVPANCRGIVKVADGTFRDADGVPGLAMYDCHTPERFIGVGASSTVQFGLKIKVATPNATGNVSFADPRAAPYVDSNPANDSALVVINPTTGGTGGGIGDETLPITGTQTGMLAGLGALLLLGGGAMYGLTRRRRVTVVDGDSAT
jgi:LPXTG-motif cell wall-anchored protein